MKQIFRHWKIIYLTCCLLYAGWMIHVADIEFYRINSQYRQLKARLRPERIRESALEELIAECYREVGSRSGREKTDCSAWPAQALEEKTAAVKQRRREAKQRGMIKVVLFYTGFVVIFLFSPMILGYLLISAIILLYRNIKIVRE